MGHLSWVGAAVQGWCCYADTLRAADTAGQFEHGYPLSTGGLASTVTNI